MANRLRIARAVSGAALATGLLSCGGDTKTGPDATIGPPSKVVVVSGDEQAGTVGKELPEPVVVRVTDAAGHAIGGQLVNFRVTSGGGSVFAGTAQTNSEGEARERWTLGTTAGDAQALEARAVDATTGAAVVFATFHATASADAPAAMSIASAPGATTVNGAILTPAPAVQLRDQFGNLVRHEGVAVTASLAEPGSDRTLGGSTTVNTGANGIATFSGLTVRGKAGTFHLVFTSASLTPASSGEVALVAGAPVAMTKVAGDQQIASVGTAVATAPSVKLADASGNPVSGATVVFAVTSGGGTVANGSIETSLEGIATPGSWTLGIAPGENSLAVTAGSLSVSFTATATAGSATMIVAVSPPTSSTRAGMPAELTVRVTDSFDNPVPGAAVTWTPSSGTMDPQTSTSDAQGLARSTVTFTSLGTGRVTAAISSGASVTFSLTVGGGEPSSITKKSGDALTAVAGMPVPGRPTVEVHDAFGNPVAGAAVAFEVTGGGGSITGGAATTDGYGIASVGSWTLGPLAGAANTLKASTGNVSTTFTATATNPITLAIDAPADGAQVGASVTVRATASSKATNDAINSVVAAVEDQQVALAFYSAQSSWSGTLDLQGLTPGPHTLIVTAHDANSNSLAATRTIYFDDPAPVLAIESPTAWSVYASPVRLSASCTDNVPGCTITITRSTYSGEVSIASGQEHVETSSAVPDGAKQTFRFRASDAAGHTVVEQRTVYVESSSRLVRLDSVPGGIMDADADRILYASGAYDLSQFGVPTLRQRSTRQDRVFGGLVTHAPNEVDHAGYLTDVGALVTDTSNYGRLYEYRNGALGSLGLLNSSQSVVVRGDYAIWSNWQNLQLRDLLAGTTTTISTNAGNWRNDVTESGVVAYWSGNYQIVRYHDGVQTVLTPATEQNVYPRTDGDLLVYAKRVGYTSSYRLMMLQGGVESELPPVGENFGDYQVVDGWIAYTKSDAAGASQIWMRSPTGQFSQLTPAYGPVRLESLDRAGNLVYQLGNLYEPGSARYVVRGGDPSTVTQIGSALGIAHWIDGRLYVAIGGTLFRAVY